MDSNNRVRIMFPAPVEAQYLRVIPKAWKHNIAIKFDILGCSEQNESLTTDNRNKKALSAIQNLEESMSEEHKQNYGPTLSKLKIILNSKNEDSDLRSKEADLKGKLEDMLNEGLLSKKHFQDVRKSLDLYNQEGSPDVFSLLGTEMFLYNNILNSDKEESEINNLLNLQEIVIQEKLEDLMTQGLITEHEAYQIDQSLANSRQRFKEAKKQLALKKMRDVLQSVPVQEVIERDLVELERLLLAKKDINQIFEKKEDIFDKLQHLKSKGVLSDEKMQNFMDNMNNMISEGLRDSSNEAVVAIKDNLDTYTKEIVSQSLKTLDKVMYTDKINKEDKRKLIKEEQKLLLNKLDEDFKSGIISVNQWMNSKTHILALTNNALVDVELNNLGNLAQKLSKLKGLAFSSHVLSKDTLSLIGEEKVKVLDEIKQMGLNGEITKTREEELIKGLDVISDVVAIQKNYNKLETMMENIMQKEDIGSKIGSEMSEYLQLLHFDENSSSEKLLSQKTYILKELHRLNEQGKLSNSDIEGIAHTLIAMTDDLTSDSSPEISKNTLKNAVKMKQVIEKQEENIITMKSENLFSNTGNLAPKHEVEKIKKDFQGLILTIDKAEQIHKATQIRKKLDKLIADGSLSHEDKEAIVDKLSSEIFETKEEQVIFDKLNSNIQSIISFDDDDDEYMKIYSSLLALGQNLMTEDYENHNDSINHELYKLESQGIISSSQSDDIKKVLEKNLIKQVKKKDSTEINLPESIQKELAAFKKLSKLEYSDDHFELLTEKKNQLFKMLNQEKQIGRLSEVNLNSMLGMLDSLILDLKSKKSKLDHVDKEIRKAFSDETLALLGHEVLLLAETLLSTNEELKRDKVKSMLIDNIDKKVEDLVSQGVITEKEGRKIKNERETFLFNLKPIFYDKKVQNKLTNLIPEQSLYMLKDKLDQINKISEESDNEIGSLDLINLKENEVQQTLSNLLSQGQIDEDTYKNAINIISTDKEEENDIFTEIENSLPMQFHQSILSDLIKLENELSSDEVNIDTLIKQKKKLSDNLKDMAAIGHINNEEYKNLMKKLNSDILKKVKPKKILDQLDNEVLALIQEDIENIKNPSLQNKVMAESLKKKINNLVKIGKLTNKDTEKLGLLIDLKLAEVKIDKKKIKLSISKIDNDFNEFKGSLLKTLNIIGLSEKNIISPQILTKTELLIYEAKTKEEIEKALEILTDMKHKILDEGEKLKREALLGNKEFAVLTDVLSSLGNIQESLLTYSSILPSFSESTKSGYSAVYVSTEKSTYLTQSTTTAKMFMYVKEGPPELALSRHTKLCK